MACKVYNGQCQQCLSGELLTFDFTMAFQPIVDVAHRRIFAHEALVRGIGDQPSTTVFEYVNDENRYAFDQACRVKAIRLAAKLGISSMLSINFMPNAIYQPEHCIQTTLDVAQQCQFPIEQIMFEITEAEQVHHVPHLVRIVEHYKQLGFTTAMDDFGSGYSGLNLLVDLPVDVIKLDMHLIRHLDQSPRRQTIVKSIMGMCREFNIQVIAEGVETAGEYQQLTQLGITLYQGFYFARPAYERIADVHWPT